MNFIQEVTKDIVPNTFCSFAEQIKQSTLSSYSRA